MTEANPLPRCPVKTSPVDFASFLSKKGGCADERTAREFALAKFSNDNLIWKGASELQIDAKRTEVKRGVTVSRKPYVDEILSYCTKGTALSEAAKNILLAKGVRRVLKELRRHTRLKNPMYYYDESKGLFVLNAENAKRSGTQNVLHALIEGPAKVCELQVRMGKNGPTFRSALRKLNAEGLAVEVDGVWSITERGRKEVGVGCS